MRVGGTGLDGVTAQGRRGTTMTKESTVTRRANVPPVLHDKRVALVHGNVALVARDIVCGLCRPAVQVHGGAGHASLI